MNVPKYVCLCVDIFVYVSNYVPKCVCLCADIFVYLSLLRCPINSQALWSLAASADLSLIFERRVSGARHSSATRESKPLTRAFIFDKQICPWCWFKIHLVPKRVRGISARWNEALADVAHLVAAVNEFANRCCGVCMMRISRYVIALLGSAQRTRLDWQPLGNQLLLLIVLVSLIRPPLPVVVTTLRNVILILLPILISSSSWLRPHFFLSFPIDVYCRSIGFNMFFYYNFPFIYLYLLF